MARKNWFATLKEARAELKGRNENFDLSGRIWKWKHTKRKKPFFVGTEFQWLNVG